MTAKTSSQTLIIVLGMHRSGTSALAGLLSALGVEFGDNLIPAAPSNPKGFFESQSLVDLNDAILHSFERSWEDPRGLPSGWEQAHHLEPHRQAIEGFLRGLSDYAHQQGCSLLGIKDPRVCLTFPLFLSQAQKLDLSIVPVFIYRKPEEITRSCSYQYRLSEQWARVLTARYWQAVLEYRKTVDICGLDFDALVQDWHATLNQCPSLMAGLGPLDNQRIAQGNHWIDGKLRTQQTDIASVAPSPLDFWSKIAQTSASIETYTEARMTSLLIEELQRLREKSVRQDVALAQLEARINGLYEARFKRWVKRLIRKS